MSGFDASNSVQPQKNPRHYTIKKVKTSGHFWPAVTLFLIIILLCVNHCVLLDSYDRLKQDLVQAYSIIDGERAENRDLLKNENEMHKKYDQLAAELKQFKENYNKTSRGSEDLSKQIDELEKHNTELSERVKELTSDNIALQNSLKMAASVGVKPQNFSLFEGLEPRDTMNRGKYLGKFLGTAYTPSEEECGNDKGITKSGEPIVPGVSIAVDDRYWPFGTVFYIKGLGYTVAMDTGSAVKGRHRFDFSVLDRDFALQLGSRKWDVYLVKMGNGKARDIEL